MSKKVTIIDYGIGNIFSINSAIEFFGFNANISSNPKVILESDKLILPGVGSFPAAMSEINRLGINEALEKFITSERPLLGICLGMQLLLDESSEFKVTPGLGFIEGRVVPIPSNDKAGNNLKLPHIGWSRLFSKKKNYEELWEKTLLESIGTNDYFYFVHSYMAHIKNIDDCCIALTDYGGHEIPSVINKNNITGCQFHPEKSGLVGLKIIKNFLNK